MQNSTPAIDYNSRFVDIINYLSRPSDYGIESGTLNIGEYNPGEETINFIREAKILVIGAGGLGCEILKNLALSGFQNIHVIDADTIDITNLNRQFLFRMKDVGHYKAEIAAKFIMDRVPGCIVEYSTCFVQDKPPSFYSEFQLVIAGLDNIEARTWINHMLCSFVEKDEEGKPLLETVIPLIDGGTEGFMGQSRFILPGITSCFECTLDTIPKQVSYAMCTIAATPRKPEHCIAYAMMVIWNDHFDRKYDSDSAEDMKWIYEEALKRANEFKIQGVTYNLTLGVVKNIIPAIASTNAIIAASCCNEALKYLSYGGQLLNSTWMYMGGEGIYASSFEYQRKVDCPACGKLCLTYKVEESMKLCELIERIKNDDKMSVKINNPTITLGNTPLYIGNLKSGRESTKMNLEKSLKELNIINESILTITDSSLGKKCVDIVIKY